jgi:hypothetical protein
MAPLIFFVGPVPSLTRFQKVREIRKRFYWSSGLFLSGTALLLVSSTRIIALAVDATNGRTDGRIFQAGGGVWEPGERSIRIRTGNLELLKGYGGGERSRREPGSAGPGSPAGREPSGRLQAASARLCQCAPATARKPI